MCFVGTDSALSGAGGALFELIKEEDEEELGYPDDANARDVNNYAGEKTGDDFPVSPINNNNSNNIIVSTAAAVAAIAATAVTAGASDASPHSNGRPSGSTASRVGLFVLKL